MDGEDGTVRQLMKRCRRSGMVGRGEVMDGWIGMIGEGRGLYLCEAECEGSTE